MYKVDLNISGSVSEVSWNEGDEQVSRLLGLFHSKVLRIFSVARSLASRESVRLFSLKSTVMNLDITGAALGIQSL